MPKPEYKGRPTFSLPLESREIALLWSAMKMKIADTTPEIDEQPSEFAMRMSEFTMLSDKLLNAWMSLNKDKEA